ncbi:MAG: DNA replication and repair protein RecF [Acidimicrobiales bacterium]
MQLSHLWLTDFRCFETAEIEPSSGVTVIYGPNGSGKTSILEAIGLVATMRSFRGASRDMLVRNGTERALVRAEVRESPRVVLLEADLPLGTRGRIFLNRQITRRLADLSEALRVSVFSPSDLDLIQGPPAGRRDFLDSSLASSDLQLEALVGEVERILRHRGALLRQGGRRAGSRSYKSSGPTDESRGDIDSSFEVWDERLSIAGTRLAEAREHLVGQLAEPVASAYRHLAGKDNVLRLSYRRSWEGGLYEALVATRDDDLKHQSTSVGPHRDELSITLDGMPARTQASQGEQRCAALALRLATHELATERFGQAPTLLLDDVFSELDERRSELLAERLPPGQVLLATAVEPPPALSGSVIHISQIGTCRDSEGS